MGERDRERERGRQKPRYYNRETGRRTRGFAVIGRDNTGSYVQTPTVPPLCVQGPRMNQKGRDFTNCPVTWAIPVFVVGIWHMMEVCKWQGKWKWKWK